MIGSVIAWSIRHRSLVLLLTGVLVAWGTYAALVAPVDAIPDLSENQVIVYAEWPGHGPAEVEDQITAPLGAALNGMAGVRTIRSSSDVGAATFWIIFDDGVGMATARRVVGDRLAATDAPLPPGVTPRLAPDGPATGQVFWYTVEGGKLNLDRLRSLQDRYIKPRLAAVSGVAEVASVGGMVAEIHVSADPIRLRQHRVALPDLVAAVSASNGSASGGVVHRANAEFVVRGVNPIGDRAGRFDVSTARADLERVVVPTLDGQTVLLRDVATVGPGPQPRRGAMEKDGVEVVGGVVLMAYGENPLALTRRLKARIRELTPGLPPGVQVVPMYDRTPLILGAVETVSGTILEAMVSASLCVFLILRHARAAVVIVAAPPISVLVAVGMLELFRRLGVADIPINVMSLAGVAISIGVLVDSAIVMTENVLHTLHLQRDDFRDQASIEVACRQVGRPIVFSILVMLLSFLPVFALGGLEGKMFRPLAATKTLALAASGLLAITLVPALCSILLSGRIRVRAETESRLVRSVIEVYRPLLQTLLDRPMPLFWVLGVTCVVASAAIGVRWIFLGALGVGMLAVGLAGQRAWSRVLGLGTLIVAGLLAETRIEPLGREFLAPLDEGMVMDMPISIPRMSIAQGVDDLKARDMVLCRFPEVAMAVGKLGRAETPTDPAPLDMIETMVEFHPREFWPARAIDSDDARRQVEAVIASLVRDRVIAQPASSATGDILETAIATFDVQMREFAYQDQRELFRSPGFDEATWRLDGLAPEALRRWRDQARSLDASLRDRGPGLFTRIAIEETLGHTTILDTRLTAYLTELRRLRSNSVGGHHAPPAAHHAMSRTAAMPAGLVPQPKLDALLDELTHPFAQDLILRRKRRDELVGFGGDLDRAVPMPGWTNVWTMPIQNRVDMLATGVNTTVGIRVLGRDIDQVATVSAQIAAVVKTVPGAVDVVADPLRGKGAVEVRANRDRAARLGVSVGEIDAVVATAMGGTIATTSFVGRERTPVRVNYSRAHREDEDAVRSLLVRSMPPGTTGPTRLIPLDEVADVRAVDTPATIKGENGLPRSYVRLNVRGRDLAAFVAEVRQTVRDRVVLPDGCYVEWTGQFEQQMQAQRTLRVVVPVVLLLIFAVLWLAYRDLADAVTIMLAIPGALAGGVIAQWLMGVSFSVTIWVGYIACFGMATSTGVIMLVYLRDAIDRAGGLESLDAAGLRQAVLDGAVHRLRPKLLTEATIILGLAPMLWAGGVGGEVIRPMAAPVLGGIIVADEVIDLFLPILFYRMRLARLVRGGPVVQSSASGENLAGHVA